MILEEQKNIAGKGFKDTREQFKKDMATFNEIFTDTDNAPAEYFKEGTESVKEFSTEITKSFSGQMQSKLKSFNNSIKTVQESMADVVVKGIKGMEDALVKFVETGKLNFRDLTRSIISDMARIAIQQSITKPLTNWFSGLFSAKGNVLENGKHLTAYAKGGVINSPHFKYMANGGIAVAGEAGPEAILPLKRGAGGKLGVESSGGGSQL